ncbi:unnamed protein product [Rotaria socialis]
MFLSISALVAISFIQIGNSQYHLCYTNRMSTYEKNFYYDCLYYRDLGVLLPSSRQSQYAFEMILYCIRPSQLELTDAKFDRVIEGNLISFEELHTNKITSEQLFAWPASIDIVEQYEAGKDFNFTKFYNCTCRRSVILYNTYTQLKTTEKLERFGNISYSCYTHLECDRGPVSMCLDWREVCDNHIDCWDGGRDEENCFLLELNECAEDEFHCKGGMCIPESLLHDDAFHPDCLEETDENSALWNPGECYQDPSFHEICNNRRDTKFSQFVWSYTNHNISLSVVCWSAMICLYNLNGIDGVDCDDYCDFDICLDIARDECPALFFFPNYHIFCHIRFLYSSMINILISISIPDYICYDHELCSFLKPTIFLMNSTCRPFKAFGFNETVVLEWESLLEALHIVFRDYSQTKLFNNQEVCKTENVFHCPNTLKCITKYQLIDGFNDCYAGIDEMIDYSYSLQ